MTEKAQLEEIKKRLHELETVLNESSIIAFTNPQGIIEYVNDRFCEISQYTKEELIGSNHNIINSNYHSREFFKEMWRTIGTGNVWRGQIRNRKKDGSYYWVDTTIVPFMNEKGKPYRYAAVRHEITKLKEYENTIKQMAYYDTLTKLPNRNWLNDWIEYKAVDYKNDLTVLFIDINRFKFINDFYGHKVGNAVLEQMAERFNDYFQTPDFVIRQGGDQFIAFVMSEEKQQKIDDVVEDLFALFTNPLFINKHTISITMSIGICHAPEKWYENDITNTIETVIKDADRAMAQAKRLKGNSFHHTVNNHHEEIERYHLAEKELPQALAARQFYIVYQPIVSLCNDQVVGLEALLRWKHPTLGFISPAEFIPLLEESGYIVPIGNWIVKTVSKQMKQWLDDGIPFERVAINVSPLQFLASDFATNVKNALKEAQLDPKYLEFEVTERLLLDVDGSLSMLNEFNEMGVSIAIDDFGTGYSSLSYLNKIPINKIKIDKSFISDLNKESKAIIETIISLGNTLHLELVAEGVETEEQLNYLKELGCHEAQGFYFSKPMPHEDVAKIVCERLAHLTDDNGGKVHK